MKFNLIIFSFFLFFNAWAQVEINLPTLTGPVVDEVGLLDEAEKEELSHLIKKVIELNGPHIQILIVENLQGYTLEEFSIYVAENWKIGTGNEDNGIIVLVSKDDRKIRLEVGNGIEDRLTDYQSSLIIREFLTPHFKNSRYFLGFRLTIEEIARIFEIQLDHKNRQYQPIRLKKNQPSKIYLIVPLLLVFIFIYPIYVNIVSKGRFARGGLGSIFFIILSFLIIPIISIPIILIFAGIGFFVGLIGPSNFLMSLLYHRPQSTWHTPSRGGGFGGSGGWSGRGGGFSGGGASGDW